jgi:glycosyltransferase involved in cell wall biosynthesis
MTSNTSSLEEIAGGAAETVDPYDVDALAAALLRLGRDAAWRRELSERGLARARRFSWTRTARQMLAVYQRAAGVTTRSAAPAASALEVIPAETASLAMRHEASS